MYSSPLSSSSFVPFLHCSLCRFAFYQTSSPLCVVASLNGVDRDPLMILKEDTASLFLKGRMTRSRERIEAAQTITAPCPLLHRHHLISSSQSTGIIVCSKLMSKQVCQRGEEVSPSVLIQQYSELALACYLSSPMLLLPVRVVFLTISSSSWIPLILLFFSYLLACEKEECFSRCLRFGCILSCSEYAPSVVPDLLLFVHLCGVAFLTASLSLS